MTEVEAKSTYIGKDRELMHYLTCCYMMINSGPVDAHRRRELSRSLASVLIAASRKGLEEAHEQLLDLKRDVERGKYSGKHNALDECEYW